MSSTNASSVADKIIKKAKRTESESAIIQESLDAWSILDDREETIEEKKILEPCSICLDARLLLKEGLNGNLDANLCQCMNKADWDFYESFEKRIKALANAAIPNRYLSAINDSNIRPEVTNFSEEIIANSNKNNVFLFLYGGVGTGKTHSAAHVMLRYLLNTAGKSCFYMPVHQYQELSRNRNAYGFEHKTQRAQTQHEFIYIKKLCEEVDLLVLDEIGQDTLSQDQQKSVFALLDARYASNKPTILISNHCDNKNLTLEGKLLSNLVGARIASRIKSAKQVYCSGEDHRVTKENCEIVTQEEAECFKLDGKILTHSSDEQQIMTWLTRNPAFETVSTQRRKELTYIDSDGEEADLDRPVPTHHKDVWVQGDSLTVSGPVCDHEDKKLYALLLKELAKSHENGTSGLVLETTINDLIKILGLKKCGQTSHKIQRSLIRLTKMAMVFKNAKGQKWVGPLLNDVIFGDKNLKEVKTRIEFNRFMITFYRLHAYTTFDATTSKNLKGDSNAFYMFYLSHSMREMTVSLDRCKKLLGINSLFDKKEARKRIKTAVDNLITAKVMDPSKTFIKDGKVYTNLAADLR